MTDEEEGRGAQFWHSMRTRRILISIVLVPVVTILFLLTPPLIPGYKKKMDAMCALGPFKRGLVECRNHQFRDDNLCPLEVLDWITSDDKLNKTAMMDGFDEHLKNQNYVTTARKKFGKCIDAANEEAESAPEVADTFTNCWLTDHGKELAEKLFCFV